MSLLLPILKIHCHPPRLHTGRYLLTFSPHGLDSPTHTITLLHTVTGRTVDLNAYVFAPKSETTNDYHQLRDVEI